MLKSLSIAALSAVLFASSSQAETYVCHFKHAEGGRNVISPLIQLDVSEDGQSVFVTDSVLAPRGLAPHKASKFANDDKRIKATWHIKNAIGGGGAKANLTYSLVYKKKNSKAFVTFRASGYGNTDQETGKCALKQ